MTFEEQLEQIAEILDTGTKEEVEAKTCPVCGAPTYIDAAVELEVFDIHCRALPA